MYLADAIKRKSNNLSFIKFIAALLVIVAHAYPVSQIDTQGDLLNRIDGGVLTLGGLAVSVFFLSSGLLVCKSAERIQDTKKYFIARIRRIFPLLIFVIIITTFVIGPIVTKLTIGEYFTSMDTYAYLLNGILVPIHHLPGVFVDNVYTASVNGSLWTLPVEFAGYIVLFIIYKTGFLNKKFLTYLLLPLIVLFMIVNYSSIPLLNALITYLRPVYLFFIGMLFYVYRDRIKLSPLYGWLSLMLFFVTVVLQHPEIGQVLFFPYALLYIALGAPQCSDRLGNLGRLSYGIYLIAFPIQQIIVLVNGGSMSPIYNMVYTIFIAVIVAKVMNVYIESKF